MSAPANKETILATVEDLATNFVYYGRKEDEDLPIGAIELAVQAGVVTLDEIIAKFRGALAHLEGGS